jgi:phage baseplate assembly protein V
MRVLQNQMRQIAQMAMQGEAKTRLGIVTSYDPDSYSVKLELQPDGAPTGWLPVVAPWVGNGWGMYCPPSIGDMVEVHFQEDGMEAGFVCARFYNNTDRPLSVPAGEFWLVHASGAFFKLLNDGKAIFSDGNGATVSLNGNGTISSTGQWTHDGTFTATDVIKAPTVEGTQDVIFGGKSSAGHKHGNVQSGTDQSGTPI